MNKVIYSICIANLNMEKTIEVCLRSVLDQIDQRFEVIVVDDGSTDNSVNILKKLSNEYINLRIFELKRDKQRTLAQTRNVSVSYAQGDYLILNIDCDDYWYPYIKDFVEVYHQIEKVKGTNFLLSGQQINMGKSDFLRSHGPYRNGHMVEDRDLWFRLAKIDSYIPLEHVVFRKRMKLTHKQTWKKLIIVSTIILSDELRSFRKPYSIFLEIFQKSHSQSKKYRILKLLLLPAAFVRSKLKGSLDLFAGSPEWPRLKQEALKMSGTVEEFFTIRGKSFDFTQLSEIGKLIFNYSSKEKQIEEIFSEYKK